MVAVAPMQTLHLEEIEKYGTCTKEADRICLAFFCSNSRVICLLLVFRFLRYLCLFLTVKSAFCYLGQGRAALACRY